MGAELHKGRRGCSRDTLPLVPFNTQDGESKTGKNKRRGMAMPAVVACTAPFCMPIWRSLEVRREEEGEEGV